MGKKNKKKNSVVNPKNQKKHQGNLSHKDLVNIKIDNAFDKIQKTIKKNKSKESDVVAGKNGELKSERGFSDATKLKYASEVKNFVNNGIPEIIENGIVVETEPGKFIRKYKGDKRLYEPKHWKGEMVDYWFDKMVERYEKGEISADYIINSAHAFGKLQTYVKQYNVLGNELKHLRVGLKGSVDSEQGRLYELHCKGIVKSCEDTTSIKIGSAQADKVLNDIISNLPKNNRNYEAIKNVLISQYDTGGRISAEVGLKVKHIDLEKLQKHYEKDKNNFNHRTPLTEASRSFYEKHIEGKNPDSNVYEFVDSQGRRMSNKRAVKEVQNAIKLASEKAGYTKYSKEGKLIERVTSHSLRRAYAQKLYDSTKNQTMAQIQAQISAYVNNQGSNKEGIVKRIENERYRLNYYRRKNGLPTRDFTHEELRRLLVSLHLGHSRIDIVAARYITTDRKLMSEKKASA